MKHPKRKGWLGWRANTRLGLSWTGASMTTVPTWHVLESLKLSPAVVYRWLADPYFKKAGVAKRDKGEQWQWNVEKTRLWVHAIMCLDADAREQLGIPQDYRPRGRK